MTHAKLVAGYLFRCALAVTACAVAAALVQGWQGPQPKRPRVALTFDDLPVHGALPASLSRIDVARKVLEALKQYDAPPTYGFINAKQVDDHPETSEILRLWRAAGNPLGNHAYSHMDLHANPVEAFEKDVLANEPVLRALMGDEDWHWFRYPYLREGNTPEKHRAVRAFLGNHDYRVAQVTIDFSDWAYNAPYARCLDKHDEEGLAWLEKRYVEHVSESLDWSQAAARRLFGRDIDHVMLLHIGAFQTVMLSRLLELLDSRGFELTTLQEAQEDEVYDRVPDGEGIRAGTLLEQLRPQPPPAPQAADDLFEKLAALCPGAPSPGR